MKTLAREANKVEILRRLRTVRPGDERRWGRMSAHQMICHLIDSARMATGERVVRDLSTPLQRTVVKFTALYLPLPWPAGIPTLPEIDQLAGGIRPTDFADDLAELERLVQLMTDRTLRRPRHPFFGPMSERAWLRWAYLHMDHHLRQFGR
jgi:hypothetical protein